MPPAYASGPSVAARHLPTLWEVTLYTREALRWAVGANIVRPQQLAVTLDPTGGYRMLPYGVGADSISARAIWGNAKPHGRALLAPTMHFFDSLRLPSRGATILGGDPQRLPFEGSSRAAGEGWPGCPDPTPHHPPIKTTKRKTEECLRHSSIFCSYFALHAAIESVATAQLICAN